MMNEKKKINKKTKNIIVLAITLVLLLLLYFLYDTISEKISSAKEPVEDTSVADTETYKVGGFSVLDIVYFEYSNKEYSIGVNISANGMTKADEEDFPLNTETVNMQITKLAALTSEKILPIENKSEYGFDNPNASLTVTLSDGSTRSFIIGDEALFESMYYMLDVDNNTIYYVDSYLNTYLNYPFGRLIKAEDIDTIKTADLQKVEITSGEETATISREADSELPWHIVATDYDFSTNSDDLGSKLESLSTIAMSEVIEYKCEDFSTYGLDTPSETLVVDYTQTDENDQVTSKQLLLEFGSEDEFGYYYCRMNKSSFVYTMSSTFHDKLMVYSFEDYIPTEETEEVEETSESSVTE